MRLFAIFALASLLLFPLASVKSQDKTKPNNPQQGSTSQPGSTQEPTAIQININTSSDADAGEAAGHNAKSGKAPFMTHGEWVLSLFTLAYVIVSAFIAYAAVKTLEAINSQVVEMRNTGKQTDKLIQENIAQSTSLEKSVKETARFASAMEGVAKSLEATAKASVESVKGLRQQMRAYVGTAVGAASYQDRAQNTRFMASPWLINHGFTPAHKVRHKSKAAVLPVPLPPDFDYPLPAAYVGETIMPPRQQNQINILVDDFINDADVANVKASNGSGLYVWGTIEYEDIFGDIQHTRFCQLLTWLPDGKTVWGTFIAGHNDGT